MYKHFLNSLLMTVVLTVLLGLIYPLVVTGLSQVLLHDKANGQLIVINGKVGGSRIIGQPFKGEAYFHSRPSAAGNGYDAANSGGSNLGPTNTKLIARAETEVKGASGAVPVDLVTTSGSGLDPHITPAAAYFQVSRVARARGISEDQLHALVTAHIEGRTFGVLVEPRVNLLELNLAMDQRGKR
jgi:potassium-transporting ATPase KdpC subunit